MTKNLQQDEFENLNDLRNGSFKAFEKIYNQYSGKLYHFILRIFNGDTYVAEDIVQSTFARLWEVRAQIYTDKSVLSYLSTIAKNMLLNSYQHQTVEFVYQKFILSTQLEADNKMERDLERKWLENFVDELIEKLPATRKKIFILNKKEELSTKEIAKIMDISVSTVETHISLAMKYMRAQFKLHYDKLFWIIFFLEIFE